MLMLPVPGGTAKLTISPTALTPNDCAGSTGVPTGAACAGSHVVGALAGPETPPSARFGVPGGVHAGEPLGERHAPSRQEVSGALQPAGPVHEGKQNDEREALAGVEGAGENRSLVAHSRGTLAQVLLALGRPGEALEWVRPATVILEELGGIDECEMLVRLVHAEALAATGDAPGAHSVLAAARERLLSLADRIQDAHLRQRFLSNVPENARTLQLAEQWLGSEQSAPE
jgi:Tetratricopeptide repeat